MLRDSNLTPLIMAALLILPGSACGPPEEDASSDPVIPTDLTGVTIIPERWVSAWDTTSNLDSPAFWQGGEGSWVVSTAKGTHDLWVHDAASGELIRRVGGQGSGPGEFNYPNGIAIVDDLLLVVERDNHRVQMLSLPGFESKGWFGEKELIRPYGVAFYPATDGSLILYVTDDYGNELDPPEGQDPTGDFTRRVKRFQVSADPGGTAEATFLGAFGEAAGPGALMVVESIQVDEEAGLLLVADEHNFELELYGLSGEYLERTEASGLYQAGDPEGIMLYRCGPAEGYWILTDQGSSRSVFHVLNRASFDLVGSFAGEVVANTDGIWLTQEEIPGLGAGALFALHDDGGLGAFAWEDIAEALGLRVGCRGR